MLEPTGMLPERPPQGGERWMVAGFAAGFVGLMVLALLEDYEPRKLSVIFVVLSWIPLLVIHEAGHAVVARACGWEVERVVIGFGRTWRTFLIGGTPVIFKTVPLSGYVLPRPRDLRSPRLKNSLIYAGGPGFEWIAALAVLFLTGPDVMFQPSEAIPVIAAQSFCVAAALGLVFNLVPHRIYSEGSESWSDGLGILASWKLPDRHFARRIKEPEEDGNQAEDG